MMEILGTWKYKDPETGFHILETAEGRTLRVADLVEDERDREQVMASLKDPRANEDRDWVDVIIALGMAKEGFDWIWCEHALTVGYRSSLTEIVQIIGRSTRDAPGKTHARFSNFIALPDIDDGADGPRGRGERYVPPGEGHAGRRALLRCWLRVIRRHDPHRLGACHAARSRPVRPD